MGKYLFAYKGGAMAQTDEERQAAMEAWGQWFGRLGQAVVDPGAPFSTSAAVGNGAGDTAGSGLTGYSVVQADSLAGATDLTSGCPVLDTGGSVDVYETIPIEM
jgi:hypothetical protein